jgi:diacylglycerol kinase family enzyme
VTAATAIPAFVNPDGGSARAALDALERTGGFEVRPARPAELPALLAEAIAAEVPRVLVAGGDGTVEVAAASLAGTPVALAVLPAGRLNHFARDHDIPIDPEEALVLARSGVVRTTDVAYVNEQLFINTSSVGAYVRFVRTRDRLERYSNYWIASFLAGLRVLATLHPLPVRLESGDEVRTWETALVFIGVGERVLGVPGLGSRKPGGARGLHVILPRGRREARRFARAYGRITRGLPVEHKTLGLDAAIVPTLRLHLPVPRTHVTVDGEIRLETTPLEYRYGPDLLRLVVPASPPTE